MDIVQRATDDLTLREAVALTGLGAKTIRRAVRAGTLPRRYSACLQGLQLVIARPALEQWLRDASPRRQARRTSGDPHTASLLPAGLLAEMSAAAIVSAATLKELARAVKREAATVTALQKQIAALQQRLAALDHPPGAEEEE